MNENPNRLLQRIQVDMAAAMKSRDAATLSTLRMLKTALMEMKTQKARDAVLTADEEIEVVQRYAKKRREAIDEFRKLGRDDLVASEQREIEVAGRYLPRALGEDEIRERIRAAGAEEGAAGPRDKGTGIGLVKGEAKGQVEGGTVSRLVKEILAG